MQVFGKEILSSDQEKKLQQRQAIAQGMNEWKKIIEERINCDINDINCWKRLLPELPCNLADTSCWKSNYPKMPCSSNDEECWKQLLPQLPCKLHDQQCWRNYHSQNLKKYSIKPKITVDTIASTMINDTESIWLV